MESPRRLLNVQLLLPQQKKLCVCRLLSAGTRREISFIITIHICVCIINTHFHLTHFSLCTINVWCCYRYRPRFRQHYHGRHIILIFFCVLPGLWGSYCFLIPCCGHCRLCCAMLAEWSILCAIPCLYVCGMYYERIANAMYFLCVCLCMHIVCLCILDINFLHFGLLYCSSCSLRSLSSLFSLCIAVLNSNAV